MVYGDCLCFTGTANTGEALLFLELLCRNQLLSYCNIKQPVHYHTLSANHPLSLLPETALTSSLDKTERLVKMAGYLLILVKRHPAIRVK
jgi:hypothetical protein